LANRSSKIQFNIVEYILQEIGQPAIPLLAQQSLLMKAGRQAFAGRRWKH
jgi:hypothetical protein